MTQSSPSTTFATTTNPAASTPMMRQYLEAKEQHPDAIVLFRMGDFYETFFEDAVDAARILELTLTSRNKKDSDPIPMAGVPHHALWNYVPRLLEAGRRIAICEQVEDPRRATGIVKRQVVRVITPGVVLHDAGLKGATNNFLAALKRNETEENGPIALAWVDASTGQRSGTQVDNVGQAMDELARVEPAELLVPTHDELLLEAIQPYATGFVVTRFSTPDDEVTSPATPLESAAQMIDDYLAVTQVDGQLALKPLERRDLHQTMRLGAATVRNLELLRTLGDGKRKGSLLDLMDRTRTAMGGRMLKQWLLYPLTDPKAIRQRLDRVQAFSDDPITRGRIREGLDKVYDLERIITKVVAKTAAPRDLAALADSLECVEPIKALLLEAKSHPLSSWIDELDPIKEAATQLRETIVDAPPATLKDGGVIRQGCHSELDTLIEVSREGKAWFTRYAETLKEETHISSLKVRYNNVFGYFIEVTKSNLQYVPETWHRKQTLANAERFFTAELKEREELVMGAHDRRLVLEYELFDALRDALVAFVPRIQATADGLASLDVMSGLAELAQTRGFVRPEVDQGQRIDICEGRHPVIESLLPTGEFVPNDTSLDADEEQIMIITGPNMAGKSTVMRQVALIVLMAQMGSFVPASRAKVGVVDQIFTRVGASDYLTKGLSTFMVEMTECATILTNATSKSLVILDEIGRGTSTYDGVSIAWAVAEHLHDEIGARTLFATHYHELTELAATRSRIINMTIAVRQWKDDIVFLRQLVQGGTNRSYGIQVARLAGVPDDVVGRAKEVLSNLEWASLDPEGRPKIAHSATSGQADASWQLNLFAGPSAPSQVEEALSDVDIDGLSPREALNLLYELKQLINASKPT